MIQAKITQFIVQQIFEASGRFIFFRGLDFQKNSIFQGLLKSWFWIVLSA